MTSTSKSDLIDFLGLEPLSDGNSKLLFEGDIADILDNGMFDYLKLKIYDILLSRLDIDYGRFDSIIYVKKFVDGIDTVINKEMLSYLGDTSFHTTFYECLKLGSIRGFSGKDRKEKSLLIRLLLVKTGVKRKLLVNLLQNCNNLKVEEFILGDLEIILESGIIDLMDSIYINFSEIVDSIDSTGDYLYGYIDEVKRKGYRDLMGECSFEKLKEKLSKIENNLLREYFEYLIFLLENDIYDKESWKKLEIIQIELQLSNSGLFVFGPMEQYIKKGFIDPEIGIGLTFSISNDELYGNLSERHNGNDYGMLSIGMYRTFFIDEGGFLGVRKLLGKNFSNYKDLQEKYGFFVYVFESRICKLGENKLKNLHNSLFTDGLNLDGLKKKIIEILIDSYLYHENGHCLYYTDYGNIFEETKASSFYRLYLFDRYVQKSENLDEETLNSLIVYFCLEVFNGLSRYQGEECIQDYVLNRFIVFRRLFEHGLISYDLEFKKLSINNIEYEKKLSIFLSFLKALLGDYYNIKNLYRDNKGGNDRDIEKKLLLDYTDGFLEVYGEISQSVK